MYKYRAGKGRRQIVYVNTEGKKNSRYVSFIQIMTPLISVILTIALVFYYGKLTDFAEKQSVSTEKAANAAALSADAAIQSSQIAQKSLELTEYNYRLAKERATAENRAYLWIKVVEILEFEVGKPPKIRVQIENFGNTPAYELSVKTSFGFLTAFPDKPEYDVNLQGSISKTVLPPKSIAKQTAIHNVILTEQRKEAFLEGEIDFYAFGKIEYTDIFGSRRLTLFCNRFDPNKKIFIVCDNHNVEVY